ncbi:DUF417 family protein [Salmonella enterica]|uniref:DUF417 family protein n=1 Tax=Salmonella enterica TaxID=28901 RepID=UPI0007219F49|nr:DUF417 family protein [Salmonella enterica]ALO88390.1 hypothetical protein AS586_09040 [Salmonella enterica subsp. enterica serovar Anatum]
MDKYLRLLSQGDRLGLTLIRLSIAIVFIWIGLLKFVPYEADSITPFVANSPFMSFFYEHPEEYRQHLTHEGELKLAGGVLAFLTPFVTLSFLITTPEAWVMPLGDAHYGFPYLSGAGRLVLKDTLMLAGAVMIMADSARSLLLQRQ